MGGETPRALAHSFSILTSRRMSVRGHCYWFSFRACDR